ncbi:MAG: AmmeMemoRadiSam system protein A [Acidobacteria bacterium]|nr:AmmeMemoRadiSam system protein A [Acidobacteriota bacterium]
MTTDADRRLLLALARGAIVAHVTRAAPPTMPDCPAAREPGGAFVTIHARGDLRGCIGHVEPGTSRGTVIASCAVQACSADPRFAPVGSSELARLEVEISLLGLLEPIGGPDHIEVGRHGLLVERGARRGLLLPQVATEWSWNREAFLAHTCRKAGLPADAWRTGAALWRFEAEVFASGQ